MEKSDLAGMGEYAWEKLAFTNDEAQTMRAIRPTEERVHRWHRFLESSDERRDRSTNSNRVDAEALACIDALRDGLRSLGKDHVQLVLVTRVMSLFHATGDAKALVPFDLRDANFLRHPRMLLLPKAEPRISEELLATLGVALDTFDRHLTYGTGKLEDPADEIEKAREIFVSALHDFERASFAFDLRDAAGATTPDFDTTGNIDVERLLSWFASDDAFEKVIRDEIVSCVEEFGFKTYSLGQVHVREPIDALIEQRASPRATSVRPLICGAPGPVYFTSARLRDSSGICEDLEQLLGDLKGKTSERYLAWALLHACRGRWDLARIYSRSAIDVAQLAAKPDTAVVQEANLLLVQARRLGGIDGEDDKSRAASERFENARNNLIVRDSNTDPRPHLEMAAQLLEVALTVDDGEKHRGARVGESIRLLLTGLRIACDQEDDFHAARALAQLLANGLAALRQHIAWTDRELAADIRGWHAGLKDVMKRLRARLSPDEIPRRVFAMDIVGYLIGHEKTGGVDPAQRMLVSFDAQEQPALNDSVPEHLRHFARELHMQLKSSRDQIGRLIANELEKLVGQENKFRQWELIYAPIWPSSHSKKVIEQEIKDPRALAEAKTGLDILSAVAGPSQLGVDPAHRRAFKRAAKCFDDALDRSRAAGSATPPNADFLLRMESCYARLLRALVAADPKDRAQQLQSLAERYQTLSNDYPQSATTHFRLHVIFSELDENDGAEGSPRAMRELLLAIDRINADPRFQDHPDHWIRSTMCRRLASPLFTRATELRAQLLRPAGTEENQQAAASPPSREETMDEYLEVVRKAFGIVYAYLPFDRNRPEGDSESSVFYRLEAERRINNVVFGASLFLEVQPDYSQLHPAFNRADLLRLTERLHPNGIDEVQTENIVHTIGCAYRVLGDTASALQAGERLMGLIYDRGATLGARPGIVGLIEDALRWSREAESHLVRIAS